MLILNDVNQSFRASLVLYTIVICLTNMNIQDRKKELRGSILSLSKDSDKIRQISMMDNFPPPLVIAHNRAKEMLL